MKKTKKLLALFLSAALSVSCITTIFADDEQKVFEGFHAGDEYKGVDLDGNQDKKEEEPLTVEQELVSYADLTDLSVVGILGYLHILDAYNDQNEFKPNVYVSRAEMADACIRFLNIPVREGYSGSMFYDVPMEHEKANIIYTAYESGLIAGYSDNTFRPDEVLSYSAAVSMMTRALGYSDISAYMGGYSSGYLKTARDIGLLKNFHANNQEALTRIEMAQLLYNALECPMLNVDIGEKISVSKDGEIPLEAIWKLTRGTDIVNANSITSLTGEAYGQNEMTLGNKVYAVDGHIFDSYLGYQVNFYYKDDNTIVYMSKTKDVVEKVIKASEEPELDEESGKIVYCPEDSKRNQRASIDRNYALLYNGDLPQENYTKDIFKIKTGQIRLVSNDRGASYKIVMIEEYKNYVMANAFTDGALIKLALDFDMGDAVIDTDKTYVEIYSGKTLAASFAPNQPGQKLSASALKKNSVISVYAAYTNSDEIIPEKTKRIKIAVSQEKKNGVIRSRDLTEYKIRLDEDEYTISKSHYFNLNELVLSEEKSFYADAAGELVALRDDKSGSWLYGYLVKPYFDDDAEEENTICALKILNTKGTIIRFEIGEKLKINGKTQKGAKMAEKLQESAKMINPTFQYSQLIKYRKGEDENTIREIQTVTSSIGRADGYNEDQLSRFSTPLDYVIWKWSGGCMTKENEHEKGLVFQPKYFLSVPTEENGDENIYGVFSPSADTAYTIEMYDVKNLTASIGLRYVESATEGFIWTSVYNESAYPVMFEKSTLEYDEKKEESILKIYVAKAGETSAEYYSYNFQVADGLKKGQLIFLKGHDKEVTSIKPVKFGDNYVTSETIPSFADENACYGNATSENSSVVCCWGEPYVTDSNSGLMVMQRGALTGKERKRQIQFTGSVTTQNAQHGGILVWDENGGKPKVYAGSISDFRSAKEYGQKASKVLSYQLYHGFAIQYVIYNFD